ncbi:hypothetical protein HQ544_01685 [Candidatus Falkowbacteria bacterium]|nr:hypothetical protein [Candidatus Falkowbacteria bacterium]
MSYQSVDKLQNALAKNVFHYTKDAKKASGRALGTIVEIISYYLLKTWGFEYSTSIEKRLEEFGNIEITHNVEYSLHPVKNTFKIKLKACELPITSNKLLKNSEKLESALNSYKLKNQTLLSSDKILRNSCVLGIKNNFNIVAFLDSVKNGQAIITIAEQHDRPYAIVECKRVGVEEGNKKGPQTIEKAKQGAYVANAVSSLQKIRHRDGKLYGILPKGSGQFYLRPYEYLLKEIISSNNPNLLKNFILTVGVVSNHGNWFTSENPNKELVVLSHAYDWLVFLTDQGISEFIEKLILSPNKEYSSIKRAFTASYSKHKKKNQFTKVQMDYLADQSLQKYFSVNIKKIEKWFNIITPKTNSLAQLKEELNILSSKSWFKFK